jgi:hypothetical protein
MNHPITPLASAEVGHDTISIELLEPTDGTPHSYACIGRYAPQQPPPPTTLLWRR